MTYHIRCKKGDKTVRTIKDVKGHHFVQGMPGLLLVHCQNEERVFVSLDHFDFLDFSNGWAEGEAIAKQAAEVQAEALKNKQPPPTPVITGPGGAS